MALQTLRKGASGWIAKIFLVVLTLSFVVWGIADVFRGFGSTTVASVGGEDISADAFRSQYLEQLQQLGRRAGRGISPAEAKAFGLDRQVLNQMIADATLDVEAKRLGLAVGDAQIAKAIQSNPAYRRPGAEAFDPAYFAQLLRSNGLTEQRFVNMEKRRALREQVIQSFGSGLTVPQVLVDAVHRYESEDRSVSYLLVSPKLLGPAPTPTEDELRAFFDAHKITFRAPEYRKISVLALTPEALAGQITVSDQEAKDAYDRELTRFGTPEKREVQQMVFTKPEEAEAASAKIKAGTSFADVATAQGLTSKDTDLGLVAKPEILDPRVGEVAFTLGAGTTSDPVTARFGSVIVHVVRVEPAHQRPFDEVKALIIQELSLEKARRALLDKHDAIEDERASGATLAETAKKVGLPLTVIDVDRSGHDAKGDLVEVPGRTEVVAGGFSTPPGVEADTIQLPQNGGFVWYETDSITPARDRTFDEARAQVAERFEADRVAKAVETRARELFDQAKGGAPLDQVASAAGLEVQTADGLKRGRAGGPFSTESIAQVFDVKEGGVGLAEGANAPDRVVFQVTKVSVPPAWQTNQQVTSQLTTQMENDLLVQYLGALQDQMGVKINQNVLAQATGTGAGS